MTYPTMAAAEARYHHEAARGSQGRFDGVDVGASQTLAMRFGRIDLLLTALFVYDCQISYAKSMGLDTLNTCCIVVPSMRKFV